MSIHDRSGLCPDDPASLAELIALHREMFGGWRMEAGATPPEPPTPPPAPPAPIPQAPPTPPHAGGDGPLGEPGLKALQAERDARAKAEKDLAALRKQIEDAAKTADEKRDESLAKMAAELEALKAADARRKAAVPRPDPSIGKGGGDAATTGSVSSGRDLFAQRHPKKTT